MIITIIPHYDKIKNIIIKFINGKYDIYKPKYNNHNLMTMHMDNNINRIDIMQIELYSRDNEYFIIYPNSNDVQFDYENMDMTIKITEYVEKYNVIEYIIKNYENCINYNYLLLDLSNNNYILDIIDNYKYLYNICEICEKIIFIDARNTIVNDDKNDALRVFCELCKNVKKIIFKNKMLYC
jgi:hypothetical protein